MGRKKQKSEVRPLDFSKIKKLSQHYVQILETLFQKFPQLAEPVEMGRALSDSLSEELSVPVHIKYVGIEEHSFSDWLRSFSTPCAALLLGTEPEEGKVFIELDYALCRRLIDRLLGGPGEFPQDFKPLTPMEEGVLEFAIAKALHLLKNKEGILGPVSLRLLRIVNESRMLSDLEPAEQLGCVFKFYLGIGGEGGYVRIYFPHPLVEGTFLREDIMAGVVPLGREGEWENQLGRINHIRTSLWSEVGRVRLMASEQAQLEKGDVILFDETLAVMGPHGLSGKAILRVGDQPSGGLLAEVVDAEGKMVVKVLDYYGGE